MTPNQTSKEEAAERLAEAVQHFFDMRNKKGTATVKQNAWNIMSFRLADYNNASQVKERWVDVSTKLPYDNTDFEVWVKGEIIPMVAHYNSREYYQKNYDDPDYMEEGWYFSLAYEGSFYEGTINVTHYRPLPTPPNTKQ